MTPEQFAQPPAVSMASLGQTVVYGYKSHSYVLRGYFCHGLVRNVLRVGCGWSARVKYKGQALRTRIQKSEHWEVSHWKSGTAVAQSAHPSSGPEAWRGS